MTNNNTTLNMIDAARDALATINTLTRCDCNESLPRSRDCIHTHASRSLRELLIDINTDASYDFDDDAPLATATHDFMRALLNTIISAPYQTETLTELALAESLCPMHMIDYAICFDDDDDECRAIRMIHPNHDT